MNPKVEKLKKHLFTIGIMFMLVIGFCVCMQKGVAAADEKAQVRTTVKKVMTAVKKSDDKTLYRYMTSSDKQQMDSIKQLRKTSGVEQLKQTLPSYYNYLKKNNKRISYKILTISVKGNKATVKLRVKHVNSKQLAQKMVDFMAADLSSDAVAGEINALDSVDKMAVYAVGYAEGLFARASGAVKTSKMKTETITIRLKKAKGKWFITDDNTVNPNQPDKTTNGFTDILNLLYADVFGAMEKVDTKKVDFSKINVDQLMAIIMEEMNENNMDLNKLSL